MKISSIPQLYRNLNRGREILSVLSKYGLADWLSGLNLEFAKGLLRDREGEVLARMTREARVRMALSDLGPTAIKLGQLLSTRPDLVGNAVARELCKLQDATRSDAPDVVRATLQDELGQPVERLFQRFDDTPVASASIGQVHHARLHSGEEVVVKVQHAGIDRTIRGDLEVLMGLAILAERIPELARYRPVATMQELQRMLTRELDFTREERSLRQFASRFSRTPYVRIPRAFPELCTARVLTMERLDGIKFSALAEANLTEEDLAQVARHGAQLYLDMIFRDGVYHADPHPGNVLLLPNQIIGLLDFGMVGRVEESLREEIEDILLAVAQGDASQFVTLVVRMSQVPTQLDERALRSDAADFIAQYAGQEIAQLDLSQTLTDMNDLLFRYQIVLPAPIALLTKVLITLEGTSRLLSADFSLMELLQPYQHQAARRRRSPTHRLRKIHRLYLDMEYLAGIMPRRLGVILDQIQSGTFNVHLEHRGLGPSVNRLVLGMLASALFIGSSLLLSRQVPPLLFQQPSWFGLHNVSLLGMLGCTVSILLGLRLLAAIGKSGHLDSQETR